MWPFRKKKPAQPEDRRNWDENWQVGDVAECIVDGVARFWADSVPPWLRPEFGQQLVVTGFCEGLTISRDARCYFLKFAEYPCGYETVSFRKVRAVKAEDSEVVQQILKAKPGKDRVREDAE